MNQSLFGEGFFIVYYLFFSTGAVLNLLGKEGGTFSKSALGFRNGIWKAVFLGLFGHP